jgi:hypothetical protein
MIKAVYEERAGSQKLVLQRVRAKHPEIAKEFTAKDVSRWFLEHLNTQKKQRGYNSYVAPEPLHELEMDLMEYKYKQPPKERVTVPAELKGLPGEKVDRAKIRAETEAHPYALVAVDPFTKKIAVEPMKLKTAGKDWIPAVNAIIEKLGKPKVIFTDPDASVLSGSMKKWFEDHNVKSVITRQHAHMAERAIRTIKKQLDDELGKDKYKDMHPESLWTKHIDNVINWYNKENKQATTNMTPDDAAKPENEFDVKTNLEIRAARRRKYQTSRSGTPFVPTARRSQVRKSESGISTMGPTKSQRSPRA